MLFASIQGPTYKEALKEITTLEDRVDGFELRLDLFKEFSLQGIKQCIRATQKKTLLTAKRHTETLWDELCSLQPDYIDVEYGNPLSLFKNIARNHPSIQILCSHHDFEKTPQDLSSLFSLMQETKAHAFKIACFAQGALDMLRCMEWIYKHPLQQNLTCIAMGEFGAPLRVLGPLLGNWIDYAPASYPTAPGQLSLDELLFLYRYRNLHPNTDVFALIGDPVSQSIGSAVHNAVFRQLQREAVYLKIRILPEEFHECMQRIRSFPFFRGLSVTMPYKEKMQKTLLSKEPINTVLIRENTLFGYNTDGYGAVQVLEKQVGILQNLRICILGCGGVAKGIAWALIRKKAYVHIVSRSEQNAKDFAAEIGGEGGGYADFPVFYDVLINATSQPMPISEEWIIPNSVAMDVNTIPQFSLFLQAAQKKGCLCIPGYQLFIEQAAQQQQIWFGREDLKEKESHIIEQTTLTQFSSFA